MRVSFTLWSWCNMRAGGPHSGTTGTAAALEASLCQNLHLTEFQTTYDMHIPGSGALRKL